ncbi:MAG: DUF2917 domain-containing protein [Spirochaetes bacterium]|nr:DUF2917 domain-containing protein [Spirochaetota bacterium]
MRTIITPEKGAGTDSIDSGRLSPGQVANLSAVKGRTLVCTSGWLWITFENDWHDYVLWSGQELEIDVNAGVVLTGPQGGSYRLD